MSTDLTTTTPSTDLAQQMEFARAVTTSTGQSILPDAYRGNPANVLIAVNLGASMGLSPAESLYRISVIKGKPSAGAELIAANVRKAGHRLRVVGDETTCTATIIRADDPDFAFAVTRDLAWAQRMGLANEPNYRKQPGTMLQWRAITAVARLACPEALYGVAYTPDEVSDSPAPSTPAASERSGTSRMRAALAAPAVEPDPAPDVIDAEVIPDAPAHDVITEPQKRAMHAAFRDAGVAERADRLAFAAEVIGHDLASSGDLTKAEASAVIDALKAITAPDQPDAAMGGVE